CGGERKPAVAAKMWWQPLWCLHAGDSEPIIKIVAQWKQIVLVSSEAMKEHNEITGWARGLVGPAYVHGYYSPNVVIMSSATWCRSVKKPSCPMGESIICTGV